MSESEIYYYKCPECNEEMELGFVTTNHSIRWANEKNKNSIWAHKSESLTGSIWKTKNPACSALRCRNCNLVIFKSST